jgi:lipid A ethanolaminephosphotransferase
MRFKDDQGRINSSVYVFALTLFFTLVSNMPLWVSIYKSTHGKFINHLGFYLSIVVFVFCLLYVLMTMLVWPYVHRIILSVLLFISGVTTYAAFQYGTKVDSGVVQSVLFTGWGEIYAYFSLNLMVWLFFIAVIPIVLVWMLKVKFSRPFWKEILSKLIGLLLAILIMSVMFFAYSKEYFPYFRNHMSFRSMVNPINYISSLNHYIKHKFKKPLPFKTLGTDAVDLDSGDKKHNILVLVVGETARSMNYSLNGYEKKTNPYLEKQAVIIMDPNFKTTSP